MEQTTDTIGVLVEKEYNSTVIESSQIDVYRELMAVGKIVVKPTYDRETLLAAFKNNSTHRRCIQAKANAIAGLGYKFKDNDKAIKSGVIDFCNSLYDKNGSPYPLSSVLKSLQEDFEIFGDSRLEIVRIGKEPQNLLNLSSRSIGVTADRKSIYQFDRTRSKVKEFKRYGTYTKQARDTMVISNNTAEDDYYGVPCYVSALTSIDTGKKINVANNEGLDNVIDPSMLIVVSGYKVQTDEVETVRTTLAGLKSRRNSAGMLNFGNKDAKVEIPKMSASVSEGGYTKEKESISLEILSLHGLTPELFGVLSNGGISSGEKATGALKIFLQTTVRPAQQKIQKQLTEFFRNEFPGFGDDNEFILETIDLTDSKEDADTELVRVNTLQAYINTGSFDLFNEYRESINKEKITEEQWKLIVASSTNNSNKLTLSLNQNKKD
jgi:phage portal protein BeeE